VADDLRTPRAPRARPVVDLPGEAMLAHAEELAKRWAIALILARPLEGLADLPLEELAREAPSLCAQALRAMQSDVELERLTGAGASSAREDSAAARRLAGIVGARDAAAAVTAVEALRGVLWETLLAQLSEPSARLVGDMSDRLAYVCAATLAAAVDAAFAPGAGALSHEGDLQDAQSAGGAGEQHARELEPLRPPGGEAVIVDERAHADEHGADAPRGEPASDSVPPQVPGRPREARPLSWDESPPVPPRVRALSWDQSPPVPPRVARASERPLSGGERPPSSRETPTDEPEIEIRDERREEGPAAWIGSIGARLERFERDRLPFVVLLVELIELEHVRREELSELAGLMEQALASALGAAGSLTRERPGRCWLLVSETDGPRAQQLAERLVDTAAMRTSRRGTPLRVAIGTAVCPEDGREAAMLAAHADVGLYAARSAVRSSSPRQPATPVDESA
jgi:hypothetical protein